MAKRSNYGGPPNAYEVGYGKPPVGTRFQKGVSGNPRGRPKGSPSLFEHLDEILNSKVSVRNARGVRKMPVIRAILIKQAELAAKGDQRSVSVLMGLKKHQMQRMEDSEPDATMLTDAEALGRIMLSLSPVDHQL